MASGFGLNGGKLTRPPRPLRCPQSGRLPQGLVLRTRELIVPVCSPGQSRCFPFWQEMLACYVVNTTDDDDSGKRKCLPALEDYYECLHHKKEAARIEAMQVAYRRRELSHPQQDPPKVESIRRLGILGGEEDTKKVLATK
ncbi:MAG: hypothetical protein M1829_000991 [Trizodia sp. TS-e1964]|nr:MAG: hypothetical protein M1829_000991 [Trizodia sp. TS-e1964]